MRLVTWNYFRGEVAKRAQRLSAFIADLTALQECRRPLAKTTEAMDGVRLSSGVGTVLRCSGVEELWRAVYSPLPTHRTLATKQFTSGAIYVDVGTLIQHISG